MYPVTPHRNPNAVAKSNRSRGVVRKGDSNPLGLPHGILSQLTPLADVPDNSALAAARMVLVLRWYPSTMA